MPRIVCFGYVNPGVVFSVDRYPAANTGAYVTAKRPFIGADCAMAAQMLARWGVEVHLIGNALGADDLGRQTLVQLAEMGVHAHIALRRDLHTPYEVDISDRAGTRTFFVEDAPEVWGSLIEADLQAIAGAAMLYADWYVGPAVERAIAFARMHGVPVFLNVEYSLLQPHRYQHLITQSAYAQSPMSDVHVVQEDPRAIAKALHALGVEVAFVTRGKHGSLAIDPSGLIEVPAPSVNVVDTQGAGAVYSAAAMYGLLADWPIERVVRFATTAASLKCAQHGLPHMAVEAIVAHAANEP
ncbi:MAG: sulfofructose kinase [Candidatus Roseilinea sp.]|nr:MAG: sulfofructose kinase [Candidatus Roseilinea sp.]